MVTKRGQTFERCLRLPVAQHGFHRLDRNIVNPFKSERRSPEGVVVTFESTLSCLCLLEHSAPRHTCPSVVKITDARISGTHPQRPSERHCRLAQESSVQIEELARMRDACFEMSSRCSRLGHPAHGQMQLSAPAGAAETQSQPEAGIAYSTVARFPFPEDPVQIEGLASPYASCPTWLGPYCPVVRLQPSMRYDSIRLHCCR